MEIVERDPAQLLLHVIGYTYANAFAGGCPAWENQVTF